MKWDLIHAEDDHRERLWKLLNKLPDGSVLIYHGGTWQRT